jgi:hypothetical protein
MAAAPVQVLVYRPQHNRGELVDLVDDQFAAMQAIVGGYINEMKLTKLVATADPALPIIANEDGRNARPPANRLGLLGVFVLVRVDGEQYRSLTHEDVLRLRAALDVAPDHALN